MTYLGWKTICVAARDQEYDDDDEEEEEKEEKEDDDDDGDDDDDNDDDDDDNDDDNDNDDDDNEDDDEYNNFIKFHFSLTFLFLAPLSIIPLFREQRSTWRNIGQSLCEIVQQLRTRTKPAGS